MPLIPKSQVPRDLDLLDLMKTLLIVAKATRVHHRGAMRARDESYTA